MTATDSATMWKKILRSMSESASLKEKTIHKEIERAKSEPQVQALLEAIYLEEDRSASFRRFCKSPEFGAILNHICRITRGEKNLKICEVGSGPGFLAVALAMHGFTNVSMLEPSNEWITGTGFILSTAIKNNVKVWNDLNKWYESDELYDIIITKACVHHFGNPSKAAAEIRCKMQEEGKWLMFDEYFANTPEDLYAALVDHAHVVKYGQYEWPYPARMYVDLLRMVGFKLEEVIPFRYGNNYLVRNFDGKVRLSKPVTFMTGLLLEAKLTAMALSVEAMIDKCFGLHRKVRLFTLPQLLVFKLRGVELPAVNLDNGFEL